VKRATMSGGLPGTNPTITRTGRVGYACAQAKREAVGSAAAHAARWRKFRRGRFILQPPLPIIGPPVGEARARGGALPGLWGGCRSRALLCGGLRRRLPRDEFPAVRRFCPGGEEHELQAARLAVDFSLDRRAAGDECGIARQAHLAIAASRALVLPLSRAEGGK